MGIFAGLSMVCWSSTVLGDSAGKGLIIFGDDVGVVALPLATGFGTGEVGGDLVAGVGDCGGGAAGGGGGRV